MGTGDYKSMVLVGPSKYRVWCAMFIAECKSKKLWKYSDGSAIIPGPDPQDHPVDATTTEESGAILTIHNAKGKA